MSCSWKFTITAKQTYKPVKVEVLGTTLEFKPKMTEVETLKMTSGISFVCKNIGRELKEEKEEEKEEEELEAADREECNHVISDLEDGFPPDLKLVDMKEQYKLPSPFDEAFQEKLKKYKIGLDFKQPSLEGEGDMKYIPTDGGKCLIVHLIAKIKETPGKISLKMLIPGLPFAAEQNITFGSSYSDKFVAKYKLCCCDYDMGMDEVTNREEILDMPDETDEEGETEELSVKKGECEKGCEYQFLDLNRLNKKSPIEWKVIATEGECDFTSVAAFHPTLPRTTKRKKNEKSEVERP